jgi:transposase
VIIIGIDPHQRTHTACAVDGRTGELLGEVTVPATPDGHRRLLEWGRRQGAERRFCVEDCRHVSSHLERLLLGRGEEVIRVPPHLAAALRRGGRRRGKSDRVDALAVARAALQEPDLPRARLVGAERELRLLVDHREDLVAERRRIQQRLRWHLHELGLLERIPPAALSRGKWLAHLEGWLGCRAGAQAQIARDLVARLGMLGPELAALEQELSARVSARAAPLLAIPGCGPLTAAKLMGEIGDVTRFATAAKLAMHAGAAPIPASSGLRQRHRLNRHGNRQINAALHRMAVNQGRWHPPARAYLARQEQRGKSRREAVRALKRHLASAVYRAMRSMAATSSREGTAGTPGLA